MKYFVPGVAGLKPAAGGLVWTPTQRRETADKTVLPVSLFVPLVHGEATFTADPSGVDWVWKVEERVKGFPNTIKYYVVPDLTEIQFKDLTEVDPKTLAPTATPDPAWYAYVDGLALTVQQGAPGPQGPAGPTGPAGPQGLTGQTGATGAQGVPGVAGPAGPIGLTGQAGATGATGATGSVGATGPAGPAGPQGAQGIQGVAGSTGATGPQGPAGADGHNPITVSATAPSNPSNGDIWFDIS